MWRNGEFITGLTERPQVDTGDSAHLYGDSTFSMLRTFNGRTFKLGEHISRVMDGCKQLGIELPVKDYEILSGHDALLDALKSNDPSIKEWRTVITASRGLLPIYGEPRPWVTIHGYPLRDVLRGKSHLYDGVDAVISDVQAVPDSCWPQTIKSHARIHFRLAEQRAGDAWPILLQSGRVAEFPGANIAIVVNGRTCTPARYCLRGISMRVAGGMLQNLDGIDSFARWDLSESGLHVATEAFATCTPFSILPIRSIDGRKLECPGPITRRLTEAWIESVGCDFVAQAKRWDAE